jgi:hypothetical protein
LPGVRLGSELSQIGRNSDDPFVSKDCFRLPWLTGLCDCRFSSEALDHARLSYTGSSEITPEKLLGNPAMTKIAIKSMAHPDETFSIVKVLAALPATAIVAYHAEANLLYVRDDYAEATISYLEQVGIAAEVVERASG